MFRLPPGAPRRTVEKALLRQPLSMWFVTGTQRSEARHFCADLLGFTVFSPTYELLEQLRYSLAFTIYCRSVLSRDLAVVWLF
jgi:hypothetical protein